MEFFKSLNCLKTPGNACDTCGSCLKAMAGTHPDLTVLIPTTRSIKVDEVRDAIQDMGLKPFEARTKCIIIEPAEQLGTEGANALLKTLEEPPSSTLIILVSHRPRLLLPTIVSRCQLIRFSEEDGITPADSEKKSAGEDSGDRPDTKGIHEELVGLLRGSDPALLARKYFDAEGWETLPEVLMAVESIMRDIMVLRLGSDKVMNESLSEMSFRHVSMDEIDAVTDLIRSIRRGVNENINLRIAATELFILISLLG